MVIMEGFQKVPDRHKIYYDAEFTGLHRDTTLISIGMYSENGDFFYAEFTDYDKSQVDDWLEEHVIKNLVIGKTLHQTDGLNIPYLRPYSVIIQSSKEKIKEELINWLYNESHLTGKKLQFYTDCYAYDWMLLNDLICPEGATKIPNYIDYIPIDLSTMLMTAGVDPDITREEFAQEEYLYAIPKVYPFNQMGDNIKHNSLWDAVVAYLCFYRLMVNEDQKNQQRSSVNQDRAKYLPGGPLDWRQ